MDRGETSGWLICNSTAIGRQTQIIKNYSKPRHHTVETQAYGSAAKAFISSLTLLASYSVSIL